MTGTADLCDAREDVQPCELPFRGFGRKRRFAGPMRTVRANGDIVAIRETLAQPGLGHVLVIDAGGSVRAFFGDFMAGLVAANQWAGVVVNGGARDSDEIDRMEVGVKALGTHPRRGERTGKGERDVPVTFGGVTFVPGRWLVADADGVVVLPEGVTDTP
jgi:regulator of ribonuclease activity A